MEIDKMEFTYWMKRIMERLDILSDQIDSGHKQRNLVEGEELLDNQDVLQMLKISARTLQRYRSQGKLRYSTLSGKLYYMSSDVYRLIREGFSQPRIRSSKDK